MGFFFENRYIFFIPTHGIFFSAGTPATTTIESCLYSTMDASIILNLPDVSVLFAK